MCFAGSIRDVILMKNFDLLSIIGALFAVMLIFNLATGNFHLSFSGQPIAHSQHLWNILGMYAVGFAAVLAMAWGMVFLTGTQLGISGIGRKSWLFLAL